MTSGTPARAGLGCTSTCRPVLIALMLGLMAWAVATGPAMAATPPDEAPLLYPGLVWSPVGAETQTVAAKGSDRVTLPGSAYQSESFARKPSYDLVDYYSRERAAGAGWRYVNDAPLPLGTLTTFFREPNRYLTVRIDACAPDGTGAAVDVCVRVWLSDSGAAAPRPDVPAFHPARPARQGARPLFANPLPAPFWSQRDARWSGDRQGYPDPGYATACDLSTLGGYGCFVTSYSMLYDWFHTSYITPKVLNNNLNTGPAGGPRYFGNGDHCNNLMPGGSPYAPLDVIYEEKRYNECSTANCVDVSPQNNVQFIDDELAAGRPLLAQIHYSGNTPQHMVVLNGHSGGDYYILDPWDRTGQQRTLANGALGAYVLDYLRRWSGPIREPAAYLPVIVKEE